MGCSLLVEPHMGCLPLAEPPVGCSLLVEPPVGCYLLVELLLCKASSDEVLGGELGAP